MNPNNIKSKEYFEYYMNRIIDILKENNDTLNIVFEGIDCSGKSVLSQYIYDQFKTKLDDDILCKYSHPNEEFFPDLKELILNKNVDIFEKIDKIEESRSAIIKDIKSRETSDFNINFIDRWINSTFAYQLLEVIDNCDLFENVSGYLNDYVSMSSNKIDIDLTVFLRINNTTLTQRLGRRKNIDNMERDVIKNTAIMDNIYISTLSNKDIQKNFIIIDGNEDSLLYKANQVLHKIYEILKVKYNDKHKYK